MVKRPTQFRLSEETLARLDWLAEHLDLNRSEVVRLAVAELYERHRRARLVERQEGWLLEAAGVPIAWGEADFLAQLEEVDPHLARELREGTLTDEEALGGLLLALVKMREKGQEDGGFWLSTDYVDRQRRESGE